jgi:hypothetical protein
MKTAHRDVATKPTFGVTSLGFERDVTAAALAIDPHQGFFVWFQFFANHDQVFALLTGCLFTSWITSPSRRPDFAAGDSASMSAITAPCTSFGRLSALPNPIMISSAPDTTFDRARPFSNSMLNKVQRVVPDTSRQRRRYSKHASVDSKRLSQ